jgi:ribosome modulation factor
MRISIKGWCDENEPATQWTGTSTAFRAGARARVKGKSLDDCRYQREDFAAAWRRGFSDMDRYLSSGGILLCDLCGHEITLPLNGEALNVG